MDQKPLPEIIRRRAQNILKSVQTDLNIKAVYPTADESGNIVTCILEDGSQRTVDIVKKKEVALIKVSIEDQAEQHETTIDPAAPLSNYDIPDEEATKEEKPKVTKAKKTTAKKRQTKSPK